MNGKVKAALIATLILGVIASAIYVAPTLAYINGTTDQTRDRDMDRIRDRDCACNCDQAQNQTRTRLRLQECVQDQTVTEPLNWQYQYGHQYRHQNMLSP